MIFAGTVAEIEYPAFNHVDASLHFLPRTIKVRHVRDLVTNPLSVAEYLRRPYLRRSRYLLLSIDLQTGKHRKIYHRLTRQHFRETPLRIGLFSGSRLLEIAGPNYGPTRRDRINLAKFAKHLESRTQNLRIGIFSDDLEVIW